MKIILTTLNAKYIHTSLALRSLAGVSSVFGAEIREFTVNDNIDSIIASLHLEKADVIAFSCYIWNIEKILYIAQSLKAVNPDLKIILGGHEVSHDSSSILVNNSYIDFVISGEGEKSFPLLLDALFGNISFAQVPSLTYREDDEILTTPLLSAGDINDFPFPYDESIKNYEGKIIYYESSRGCPFNCSYCLSGDKRKVSFLDVERVKRELMFFIENNVPLVKFVDRTFNAEKKRALEIWKFIIENSKNTCFHFELAGSLLDDDEIALLSTAPRGIIQFEIGVQSTNTDTIKAIGRNIEFEKIRGNVKKLLEKDNIHIHLDLIAGLPYENYETFRKSFDDVISIRPHMLQLGFLKMLKGSRIRGEEKKYGYKYKQKAPYEVMENDFITFDEMIKLKAIEELFERYYNSGDFKRTMDFLFGEIDSPFEVFETIYNYFDKNRLFERSLPLEFYYEVIPEIFSFEGICDYVRADRLTNKKAKLAYENEKEFKEQCFEFLKKEKNIEKYLPEFIGMPARKIYPRLRFEKLFSEVYIYNVNRSLLKKVEKADFRD